ncbi:hypothetical protein GCM10009547_20370 [Sporichthya brevicatena]|uniref:Cupin domain-containing protein n=1 Tax=Sporichthya brevicatena TaxID=171442 RepID=A0ABN1GSA8_9ACTN
MERVTVTTVPTTPSASMPRLTGGASVSVDGITVGEWTLTRAAFTDRHQHVEINTVLEGELHVTSEGDTHIVRPGQTIVVPAGSRATYAAPEYARMSYVYGPGTPGMTDVAYEEF